MSQRNSYLLVVAIAAVLSACMGTPAPPSVNPAAAAKATAEAGAASEMTLYDQMRARGSWRLATTLGDEIQRNYPGTAAAATVQKTLSDVREKSARHTQARRLAHLWTYSAVPEAGGTQYAAAIASKQPLAQPGARIRLVLRQHPKWGQSVYLLLDHATFDCRKGCATLPVSFDGKPAQRMQATIPPTGEPALFIDDDKGFIAKMEKAQTVSIGVTIKGEDDKTVEFEVGGFDAAQLPDKPKK